MCKVVLTILTILAVKTYSLNTTVYKTQQTEKDTKIRFLFESTGKQSIIKAIEYSYIITLGARFVYNLGFGDYDEQQSSIVDNTNSNNGDMHVVFNTVLSTIPLFFESNPDAIIIVRGSDSAENYADQCRISCRKRCENLCRNAHRRIKIYRYFIDRNFEALSHDYTFFGRNSLTDKTFVEYIPLEEYDEILVYSKKRNNFTSD